MNLGPAGFWDDVDLDTKQGESRRTIYARLRETPFLGYAACFGAQHAEDYTIKLEHRMSASLAEFPQTIIKSQALVKPYSM